MSEVGAAAGGAASARGRSRPRALAAVPTVRRSAVVTASPRAIWRLLSDPHHLPRWWPRTERVEAVDSRGWTSVLVADSGKRLRADYRIVDSVRGRRLAWRQELEDSPFEGLLAESVTAVELEPDGEAAARVTIELRQRLRGMSRLGGWMVRRAGRKQLDDALSGLQDVCGDR